jgi:hypothetical protein
MSNFNHMKSTTPFFWVAVVILIINEPAVRLMAADETNTVRVTERIFFSLEKRFGSVTNVFSANEPVAYGITTTATNHDLIYRYFPLERSFVFKLYDAAGTEVKKTARGLEYSKAPRMPRTLVQSTKLHGSDSFTGGFLFIPEDVFVLTNKGEYKLEISLRLWVQTTNTGVPNEISQYTQPIIGTNYQFGVVTSPPVRVKIIKE